ncbi:MAG: hypothetical protein GTN99_10190 [Candidatus Dadabacteria bacterium]|nr:hypothetical protein [Candidatus Dadabacteria bacterium]
MTNPTSIGTKNVWALSAAADRIVVTRSSTTDWEIDYSSDGESFTNAQNTHTNDIFSVKDVANDGTDFLIVGTGESADLGKCYTMAFTWSTKSWGTEDLVYSAINPLSARAPGIVRRSGNSDYVIAHQDDSEKVHGTDRTRVAVSYGTTGSWTKVSSGVQAGEATDADLDGICISTDGRCHVGISVTFYQFRSDNTWASTADSGTEDLGGQGIYAGLWAALNVSSTEYIVEHAGGVAGNVASQAESQASTTWTQRTVGVENFKGTGTFDGNFRVVGVDTTNNELDYAESTDGGITWGDVTTLADSTELGHNPVDDDGIRAAGWTISGAAAFSVVYLGPSSTFYHYYITAAGAGAQPQKRPILNFINNLVR